MNVLTIPASGSILFDNGTAGGSTNTSLTAATELSYDGTGGIDITSYVPGNTDRFNVRGTSGTLFSVSDALTGTVFSVNDAAGLPIIEVNSDQVTDTIAIGEFGTNAFFVSAGNVGIGTNTPTKTITIAGDLSARKICGGNSASATGAHSGVLAGCKNSAGGVRSGIVGGFNNAVCVNGGYSTIGGGRCNSINSYNGFIGGGLSNGLTGGSYGNNDFIGGGTGNSIAGYFTYNSAIVGGRCNHICKGSNSFIGSGFTNTMCYYASNAIIGGGRCNIIGSYTLGPTIGGGSGNKICSSSYYSTIAGGCINIICSYKSHATIGGGSCNTINESYGGILGGRSNCIKPGHSDTFIVGSCTTSVSACMLHANRFFANDLPTADPGVPGVMWRSGTDVKVSV